VKRAVAIVAAGLGAAVACTNGQQAYRGLDQPLQVSGGTSQPPQSQFIAGPLPGTPATSGDDGGMDAGVGAGPTSPAITGLNYHSSTFVSGIGAKTISGFVTMDAVAVGVRFADIGTGYWVVPVSSLDPTQPGDRDFSVNVSINASAPPGHHPLAFVGIAGDGTAGPQYSQDFCIGSRVPDNGHSCFPANAVPPVVFSLTWDTNFDLDLHVLMPDGTDVNAKKDPVLWDGGTVTARTPLTGIDRDSMGTCVVDGWREEDFVFTDYPATGPYDLYADPFAACGQAAVHFTMTIYEAQSDGNLHATYTQSGELLSSQVTGGQSSGLFVAEKVFE
jgi:hypothetical protein